MVRHRGNYTAGAAAALDALRESPPRPDQGRLLSCTDLGNGQDDALRALALRVAEMVRVETITRSERLLEEPAYLMNVELGEDDADDERGAGACGLRRRDTRSRPVRRQARDRTIARAMLNLTDGLVGQGLRVLLGITTNEPLAALHPAVVRGPSLPRGDPIGRLSAAEARRGSGCRVEFGGAHPADGLTLAELFARQEHWQVESATPSPAGSTCSARLGAHECRKWIFPSKTATALGLCANTTGRSQ